MAILWVLSAHLTNLVAKTERDWHDPFQLRSCAYFRNLPIGFDSHQSSFDLYGLSACEGKF
jgi:hypothetical protein